MSSIGVDVPAGCPECLEVVHIHNYSISAIKALCSEIEKYPIVYQKNDEHNPPQLTEAAWTRVVSAVFARGGAFTTTEMAYWSLSCRELWKWMRYMLVKDMRRRRDCTHFYRHSEHHWLEHLKFAERHINLEEEAAAVMSWNPYIQVELISPDTCETACDMCRITWLCDSTEETVRKDEGISIRFETNINACNEPTIGPLAGSGRLSGLDVRIEEDFAIPGPPGFSFPPSPINSDPELSIMPPVQGPIEIDEDFEFIMSLLPKFKELQPAVNADVKMRIIRALSDVF